ncbi:hypothetical protein BD626DRAFT_476193 [Schizophyllum amplum]|uniref:Uncharacterized protein n=1 Tax=Schizophyllum amplum TaxID=97359 RepID=A0A550CZ55_9AGAR|nr:hypothetical protein BD626DRAFT_476193 [Auriculariopsis ampla]
MARVPSPAVDHGRRAISPPRKRTRHRVPASPLVRSPSTCPCSSQPTCTPAHAGNAPCPYHARASAGARSRCQNTPLCCPLAAVCTPAMALQLPPSPGIPVMQEPSCALAGCGYRQVCHLSARCECGYRQVCHLSARCESRLSCTRPGCACAHKH